MADELLVVCHAERSKCAVDGEEDRALNTQKEHCTLALMMADNSCSRLVGFWAHCPHSVGMVSDVLIIV